VAISPSVGVVRLVGQRPTVDTGDRFVAPSAGVVRFVGQQPPLGNTSALVDFDTPVQSLLVGADLQKFRVLVRKTAGTNPTVDIALYENGAWVADLVTGTAVTSEVGQIVEGTWNASLLAVASGAGVQCFVFGRSSADALVEIGAVEWQAEITTIAIPAVGTVRFVGRTPTVSTPQSVAPNVGSLIFAGQQPSVGFPHGVAPSVGTLVFAGQQPSTDYAHSVAPSVGALRFVGQQPAAPLGDNRVAQPTVGTVRTAGIQPTVAITANMWAAPSLGTLRLVGQVPDPVGGLALFLPAGSRRRVKVKGDRVIRVEGNRVVTVQSDRVINAQGNRVIRAKGNRVIDA
jgi:hypothetical protein